MSRILVDTNLLVYLYDHRDGGRQERAQAVLGRLQESGSGRLSVQSLAEFFSVTTRKLIPALTAAEALQQIDAFGRIWPVLDLTLMIALEAGRGVVEHQFSYYDAQIWATARLNQVPVIFSEDFRDGTVVEGVRFVNPFAAAFEIERWV